MSKAGVIMLNGKVEYLTIPGAFDGYKLLKYIQVGENAFSLGKGEICKSIQFTKDGVLLETKQGIKEIVNRGLNDTK